MDLFRDLLDLICERFPHDNQNHNFQRVQVRTQENVSVFVSPYGFQLLEVAEGEMGSTIHIFEEVVINHLKGDLLSAVASRLTRQQDVDIDTKVFVLSHILCEGEESALAISVLMQHCKRMQPGPLKVTKDIGREGWAALREALSGGLHHVTYIDSGFKSFLASAKREDVKAIWESVSQSWHFSGEHEVFYKLFHAEEGWRSFQQFLDLTKAEWTAVREEAMMAEVALLNEPGLLHECLLGLACWLAGLLACWLLACLLIAGFLAASGLAVR